MNDSLEKIVEEIRHNIPVDPDQQSHLDYKRQQWASRLEALRGAPVAFITFSASTIGGEFNRPITVNGDRGNFAVDMRCFGIDAIAYISVPQQAAKPHPLAPARTYDAI